MNFLAHAHVARLAPGGDDPAFILGAVLPDLLHMAGVRLERHAVPAAVAEGWRAHHRVDAAFHAHPRFTTGVAVLRADLRRTGLGTGPRRATAHVGWELLLDDEVVDDRVTIDAFQDALDLAHPLVADDRWHLVVERLARIGPDTMPRATSLARRVQRAVAARPRLAFADEFLGAVDEVLEDRRADVAAAATPLLEELVADQWRAARIDGS